MNTQTLDKLDEDCLIIMDRINQLGDAMDKAKIVGAEWSVRAAREEIGCIRDVLRLSKSNQK